jgi:hypothetical protein
VVFLGIFIKYPGHYFKIKRYHFLLFHFIINCPLATSLSNSQCL